MGNIQAEAGAHEGMATDPGGIISEVEIEKAINGHAVGTGAERERGAQKCGRTLNVVI